MQRYITEHVAYNKVYWMAKKKKKKRKIMKKVEVLPTEESNKKASNYIDNDKMYSEITEYCKKVKQYNNTISKLKENETKPSKPKVSEYIGACIMLIAQRLATKPNFANYTHRDEMIGDGIENCLMYIDNFDPDKSKNPFAYFTQIIYYAFIRRIQKEKKQAYVKMKMFERMDVKGQWLRKAMSNEIVEIHNDETGKKSQENKRTYADYFRLSEKDVTQFEKQSEKKKRSRKSNLEDFFE